MKKGTGLKELIGYNHVAISVSSTCYNNDFLVINYKPGGHHKGGSSMAVCKVYIPRYSAGSIIYYISNGKKVISVRELPIKKNAA